jgi:hypothetical protein
MIVSQSVVTAAKEWGDDNMAGQYVEAGRRPIRADHVVDLLAERTSPAAQRGARCLLQDMPGRAWTVIASIHRSPDDSTPHITIQVRGRNYHLRLDGNECVFDITATVAGQRQRPAGSMPWVGPGA